LHRSPQRFTRSPYTTLFRSKGKEIETIPATPDVKNFSYTVVDGNVYFRENSLMRRVDLNEKAKDRVMGMVELRGIVNELIEYQLEDYRSEERRVGKEWR